MFITGVGGGLLAPPFLNNTMGYTTNAKAFAAVVIGGFGSVPGAVIGGLLVGLVEAFGGALYLHHASAGLDLRGSGVLPMFRRAGHLRRQNPGESLGW